jgi:hypothetical protein
MNQQQKKLFRLIVDKGIELNHTIGDNLDEIVKSKYTLYCERLVSGNEALDLQESYELASMALALLIAHPDEDIPDDIFEP